MQPYELPAIRPCVEPAVNDIEYFLNALEKEDKAKDEFAELYDQMVAGETPADVKGQGKPAQPTEKQKKAIAGPRLSCFQVITDEQGEALAALFILSTAPQTDYLSPVTFHGFIVSDFASQFPQFHAQMAPWLKEGRVKYREDVTDGLVNAPSELIGLLRGENFGKKIIRVSTTLK